MSADVVKVPQRAPVPARQRREVLQDVIDNCGKLSELLSCNGNGPERLFTDEEADKLRVITEVALERAVKILAPLEPLG